MSDRRLLMTGAIGVGVAALCCFTPVLVALLGVVGLSAAAGWLDFVLLPVMAVFVAIIVYALIRKRRA
jgi:mercuric ion transport protein